MAILLSGAALGKSFGARVLFENLSLSLSEGDRTGLIGPNGSGKTTLLEILAGREPPGAGVRALRKQTWLAYVPQDSQFGPDDTVGSVLTTALAGMPLEDAIPRRELYRMTWRENKCAGVKMVSPREGLAE